MRIAKCGSRATLGFATILCLAGATVTADVLVLRDGRRVEGELIAVRNGVVEFREIAGRRERTIQIDRDEILRIEFNDDARNSTRDDRPFDGRPRGLREREVIVSADVPWIDTGIDVRAGQRIYFTSTGQVRWGPSRRDGPAGESNSPVNQNRPIPRRPAAALIGKVGADSKDYFFIGDDDGEIQMRSGGRLYLGINDDVLTDNSGNFRVMVGY